MVKWHIVIIPMFITCVIYMQAIILKRGKIELYTINKREINIGKYKCYRNPPK
ncbi:MAG: hypothetical protein QG562_314 [Patescibacteria group bacterium]|nr:hypothetical protein [Patescibacteria group bacterium]MDQ5958495.1 hypothetical protein [Patescibacteria group bacterium]